MLTRIVSSTLGLILGETKTAKIRNVANNIKEVSSKRFKSCSIRKQVANVIWIDVPFCPSQLVRGWPGLSQ